MTDPTLAEARQRIRELEDERTRWHSAGHRAGLVWTTDETEEVVARLVTHEPILTRVPGLDVGTHGPVIALIEGDNLDALTALSPALVGRVDIIYIDPPYNTGNAATADFRYNDRYRGLGDADHHAAWLSFMDRRIGLAKRLLAPDGFLAVSIDDHEQARLRLLLDHHFGDGNVKTIVVKMSEPAGVKMAAARRSGVLPKLKEYLLVAGPGGRPPRFNVAPIPKDRWDAAYNQYLEGFTPALRSRVAVLAGSAHVSAAQCSALEKRLTTVTTIPARRAALAAGIDVTDRAAYDQWRYNNAWRIAQSTNGSGAIQASVAARRRTAGLPAQEIVAVRTPTGLLYLALAKNGRTLLLADDHLMTHPGDLWTDIKTTGLSREGGVTFKNGKKPLALMRRVLAAHPSKHALVLDFFAGSGTTGHAVAALNAEDGGTRNVILVTSNDESEGRICETVTQPRLKNALTTPTSLGTSLPGRLRYLRVEHVERSPDDTPSGAGHDGLADVFAHPSGH